MLQYGMYLLANLFATFQWHTVSKIMHIHELCIYSVEGLDTQGLYRISSAKSKMERLCQLFESGSERVDLSDLPPHLISSCLKLYFRQVSFLDNVHDVVPVFTPPIFLHAPALLVLSACNDDVLRLSQLPEPLLTFGLYQEFLTFARVSQGQGLIYCCSYCMLWGLGRCLLKGNGSNI